MRYFIVFFHGQYSPNDANEAAFIWDDIPIKAKVFPNKQTTVGEIKDRWGLKWVHLTGIYEVSKEEFEQYYK